MEDELKANVVNTLYYLYFENKELVYHFERVWTPDGMRYSDEEYVYIFCGWNMPRFPVALDTYYFLRNNGVIEKSGGNDYDDVYVLVDYFKQWLTNILKEKRV